MDHQRALALTKANDEEENIQVRKKILEIANMMQYDDDIEESVVRTKAS
jgi:hypothetical protein